jgi:hypothetical protein
MLVRRSPCRTTPTKTGLLRALIRDAGMSIEEFVEALRR